MHFVSSNTTIQRNDMHFDVILIRREWKTLPSTLYLDRCYSIRILSQEIFFSHIKRKIPFVDLFVHMEWNTCRYQLRVLFLECTIHSYNYRCELEKPCRQRKSTGTNWKWSAERERMMRTKTMIIIIILLTQRIQVKCSISIFDHHSSRV